MKTILFLFLTYGLFAQKNIDNYNLNYFDVRLLLKKQVENFQWYNNVIVNPYACARCGINYKKHETKYEEYRSVEVLCELCFEELNSQSRLKYYWKLFVFWNWLAKEESENWTYVDKWMKIRKAVLEGK